MKDKNILNDEMMNFVSGGKLLDGWDKMLLRMMAILKGQYGDDGRDKVKVMMSIAINDPTSTIESADMPIIYKFIDDNWSTVEPEILPPFPGLE